MKRNATLLLSILLFISAYAQEAGPFESRFTAEHLNNAPAKLIPFPQEVSWNKEWVEIKSLYAEGAFSAALSEELDAIARSFNLHGNREEGLAIVFRDNETLEPEGYGLTVSRREVVAEASSETGRFYALQTLRQLIRKEKGRCRIPLCEIGDWPAYSVRGYMLDVGRNFQSMASLKKQLDIMARYKLNTFHWHLTDRPAWRIESKRYPQLTNAANHRPTRGPGRFYSYDDVRELIEYARKKHIAIIPEIDMPGHSDAFVKAMGVRMESEEGMKILENVLNELFAEIPKSDCPIIHIGSDEVRIDNPEEFISRMVGVCEANGRQVVIWNPGLGAGNEVIRQTWQSKHLEKGGFQEIDSWNNYVNNGEPMTQVQRLFFKPIGYPSGNDVIGGILCFWPDVNLDNESDAFLQNPVYPSLLTYAWATWTADVLKAPDAYYMVLPPRGSKAFEYFAAFEKMLAYHKNEFFAGEPFPYFPQTDKLWKLIGPFKKNRGGRLLKEIKPIYTYRGRELKWREATGNTLVINDRFRLGGYYPEAEAGQTVYALTYIHSDKNRTARVWIGFETPMRANRTYTGIPELGSWDPSGGAIWVNDAPLPPPVWEKPGWKPSKKEGWGSAQDQEIPWGKEELYWTRQPAEAPLKKGWNKVLARIPCSSSYQNWMFTFVPLDMEGLQFSTSPQEFSAYYYQKRSHFEQLPNSKGEIIFLGDSITDGCEWSEMFGNQVIKNRGISGDVTQGVLGRLEEVVESKPEKVFLMIGVNDLARGLSAEEVVNNIGHITQYIREASPEAEVYLQSLLPVNDAFGKFKDHTDKNEAILAVNQALEKMEGLNLSFIGLHKDFANADGKLRASLTNDGLHLNGSGYRLWAELIKSYIQK
ncbi:MAG: family 20 glycosylhydrolase [Lewinellaceae bacterium]|nr:family 20 glycosylhydrolase [Lewinellaceae bacterium]